MDIETLKLLREFLDAQFDGRCSPYDISFRAQDTYDKLMIAIQREIESIEKGEGDE